MGDQIYNSLDGSIDASVENINLAVGGTDGTVSFAVKPKNGDGKRGCNLTSGGSLTVNVASSNTGFATVDKSALTFTNCGSIQTIKVHAVAVGTATITLSQSSNSTGGSFDFAPATFTVKVTRSVPANTAPVLNLPGNITVPAAGPEGAVVTFNVTATDAEDNPDPTPLCVPESGSTFPIGTTTVTCAVTDSGGLQTTGTFTVTVGDTAAPVVSLSASGTVAASGWYNIASSGSAGVTVAVTATDNVGVTSLVCTDGGTALTLTSGNTFTLTDDVHAISCTAKDAAGNSGQASAQYKVDQTAPGIAGAASPSANAAGWNNSDVTIHYTCSDGTSGLAGACPSDETVSTEGSTTVSKSVTDLAGNSSTTSTTVKLDKTAPSISATADRAANGNSWYNGNVTVSFTCGDTGSGIKSCSAPTTLGEGADQSVTGTATDNADNQANATISGINVDQTPPTISATRTEPTHGTWNNSDVTVTFTCTDALSGATQASYSVIVSTEGADQSVPGTCTDNAGNTSNLTVTGINIDKTAPVITGNRTPQANSYGWNNGEVVVGFTCTDTGSSGVEVNTVAGATVDTEVSDLTVTNTGQCIDAAGNEAAQAAVNHINIDLTKPVIIGSQEPPANGNGWNNSPVTVSFVCSDSGDIQSGITADSAVSGGILATDGKNLSVQSTGICVDEAGNAADSVTYGGVNIDTHAPTIDVSRTPGANDYGWNNSPVAVTFTCNDGDGSGFGTTTANGTTTVSGPVASTSVSSSGECVDLAGNHASPVTVNNIQIDTTRPVITGSTGAYVPGTWTNGNVTVSFSCADAGDVQSGVESTDNTAAGTTVSAEGDGQSVTNTGSCADRAGNIADSATVSNIRIDKTKPTLTPTITGATVLNGSATIDPRAGDALSGLASSGCGSLDLSTVGAKTVTCTATDNAGNTASQVVNYTVGYQTNGACAGAAGHVILQPINTDGTSVFKLGSTVPAKFRVCDANGNSIGTAGVVSSFKLVSKSTASTPSVNEDVVSTTPDTAFRWDSSAQQWIFNISTKSGFTSGVKLGYEIGLNDGSKISFSFGLK